MTLLRIIFTLLLSMPASHAATNKWPQSVEVFLNGQLQRHILGIYTARQQAVSVAIKDVAVIGSLEDQLTHTLSPDQARAQLEASRRIERLNKSQQNIAIASAVARFEAIAYNIRKFPAIVVNHRFIYEGIYDIRRAIRLWRLQKTRTLLEKTESYAWYARVPSPTKRSDNSGTRADQVSEDLDLPAPGKNITPALRQIAAWLIAVTASPVYADTEFTTSDLSVLALSPDCIDWKFDGICFWLRCGLFGCRVVTSARVSHRLPDLVVQSYIEPGSPPWHDGPKFSHSNSQRASNLGTGITGATNRNQFSHTLNYFEVDIVGNPVADLFGRIPGRFMCRSDVDPLHPYFASSIDASAWRSLNTNSEVNSSLLEQSEVSAAPGITWGPLLPRTGFVLQPHPAKAAAVAATRAIDIVTRELGNHIATPYTTNTSTRSIRRGDTTASNPKSCSDSGGTWRETKNTSGCETTVWQQWRSLPTDNRRWQMLAPEPARQCRQFGTAKAPSSSSIDGRYGWHYWQRYRCCRKRGFYLGETGI